MTTFLAHQQQQRQQHGSELRHGFAPRKPRTAFTLIELLIVIAITAILLGLLFGPLIQSFNFTNRVRAQGAAQDAARFGLERIRRELSQATFVFDNSQTPIVFPFGVQQADPAAGDIIKTDRSGGGPVRVVRTTGFQPGEVPILFARVDFVPAAQTPRGEGVVDPTTDQQFGGRPLLFPRAPGSRIVRYWIGLRDNVLPNGNPGTYQNVYEFGSDNAYNPFVLYRAEFDPSDPDLINQDPNIDRDQRDRRNSGSFYDPNFFYNLDKATSSVTLPDGTTRTGNGRSYAANWKAIASPVMSAQRLDLLAWNRGGGGNQQIVSIGSLPFRVIAGFTPATVVGDVATPGFSSDVANGAPSAVPTSYTARHGQWVLPFAVNLQRFAGRNRATNDPLRANQGTLRVVFERNVVSGQLQVRLDRRGTTGSLIATQDPTRNTADFAYSVSRRGTIFVKSRGVTFQVDPQRGRVITAFPPLAGVNGVPLLDENPQSPTFGEPIQTVLRHNTRRLLAGQVSPEAPAGSAPYPFNTGIASLRLAPEYDADPEDPQLATRQFYYAAPPTGLAPAGPNVTGQFVSPFVTFGPSLLLVPGSERVLGPEPNSGTSLLIPYFRVGATPVRRIADLDASANLYLADSYGPPNYFLDVQSSPGRPRLVFDQEGSFSPSPQGLPAVVAGAPANEQKEVQATFLWQNNFAREVSVPTSNLEYNLPISAEGETILDDISARPDPDVVKLDYSTRSLMNVRLGARVYYAGPGRPITIEVSDRVKINNVGR